MAKEQLAVIEMVTNMILGKTEGISKVDFMPQKLICQDRINIQQAFPRRTPESQGIRSEYLREMVRELADSPDADNLRDGLCTIQKRHLAHYSFHVQEHYGNGNRISDRRR